MGVRRRGRGNCEDRRCLQVTSTTGLADSRCSTPPRTTLVRDGRSRGSRIAFLLVGFFLSLCFFGFVPWFVSLTSFCPHSSSLLRRALCGYFRPASQPALLVGLTMASGESDSLWCLSSRWMCIIVPLDTWFSLEADKRKT